VALIAISVFSLSFGFSYGVSNQLTYLVGALRMVNPGILDHDWYATGTTHYHPAYTYLSAALLSLDRSGWLLASGEQVVMFVGMGFMFWAAKILCGRRAGVPAFLLLTAIAYLTRTNGTGISYVFGGLFQPSSLGSLGLLGALPFWLRGRYLASGICMALGGLFHANFLVLGLPMFAFAHLLLGRHELPRRLLLQLGPPCLSLLLLSPIIFASVGGADADLAHQIYFHMRSPHHYVPSTYERTFGPLVGFQVLGLGAGAFLLTDGRAETRRLAALLTALFALLWTGTVLTTVIFMPQVAQVFVWRFAPFSDLWCQLLVCAATVKAVLDPAGQRARFGDHALAITLVGLGFLLMYYGDRHERSMVAMLVFVTAVSSLSWLAWFVGEVVAQGRTQRLARAWRKAGPWVAALLTAGTLGYVARDARELGRKNSFLLHGYPALENELTRFMRERTPKDAQFLSPPGMDAVRFEGQRAIVVDWKSTPILASDMVEWRNRLADVVGRRPEAFTGARDLALYDGMDQRRLTELKRKYQLDYAIVKRGRERGLLGTVAFQNRAFVVLKL